MENFAELVEINDDPRFGDITILYNTLNPARRVMRTAKLCSSVEEFNAINEQVNERQRINSPYIMNLVHIEIDHRSLKTLVYFEYPEDRLYDETLTPDEALRLFIDILQAICFLQSHKMIHGDIRPEYISYMAADRRYKLMDRLKDLSPPLQCQLNNITSLRPLYMAPIIFNELANKERKIKQHSYKSELFSLGLICLGGFHPPASLQELYNVDSRRFEDEALNDILAEVLDGPLEPLHAEFLQFLKENVLQADERLRLNPKKALEKLQELQSFKLFFAVADSSSYLPVEPLPTSSMRFYDPFEFAQRPGISSAGAEEKPSETASPLYDAIQPAENANEEKEDHAFDFVEVPRSASTDMLDHFASLGIRVDEESEHNDASLASKIRKSNHLNTFREDLVAADPPKPAPLSKLSDLLRTRLSHGAGQTSSTGSKQRELASGRDTTSAAEARSSKSIGKGGSFFFPTLAPKPEHQSAKGDQASKGRFNAEIQTTYKLARGAEVGSETLDESSKGYLVHEPSPNPEPAEKSVSKGNSDMIYGFGVKKTGESIAPRQTVPLCTKGVACQEQRPASEPSLRDLLRRSSVEEPYVILAPSMHSKNEVASGPQSSRSTLPESQSLRNELPGHFSVPRAESSLREVETAFLDTRNINLQLPFDRSYERPPASSGIQTPSKIKEHAVTSSQPTSFVPLMSSTSQTHISSPANELLSPLVVLQPPTRSKEAEVAPFTQRETQVREPPSSRSPADTLHASGDPDLNSSLGKRVNLTRRISANQTRDEPVRNIVRELISPQKGVPPSASLPPQTPNFLMQKLAGVDVRQAPLPTFGAGQSWKRDASPIQAVSPLKSKPPTRVALDGSVIRPDGAGRATPLRPQKSPDLTSPLQKTFNGSKVSDFSSSYDNLNRWPAAQPPPVPAVPRLHAPEDRPYAFVAPPYPANSAYPLLQRNEPPSGPTPAYSHYYQPTEIKTLPSRYSAQYASTAINRVYFSHTQSSADTQILQRTQHPEHIKPATDPRVVSSTWVDVYPGQRQHFGA